jgi:plastocyanin
MRRLSSVICAAAVLVLAPGVSRAVTRDVEIHDDFFAPAAMEVAQGDSIRWTHLGTHPHTVDQNAEEGSCLDMFGGFSSGLLTNGDTFVRGAVKALYR